MILWLSPTVINADTLDNIKEQSMLFNGEVWPYKGINGRLGDIVDAFQAHFTILSFIAVEPVIFHIVIVILFVFCLRR